MDQRTHLFERQAIGPRLEAEQLERAVVVVEPVGREVLPPDADVAELDRESQLLVRVDADAAAFLLRLEQTGQPLRTHCEALHFAQVLQAHGHARIIERLGAESTPARIAERVVPRQLDRCDAAAGSERGGDLGPGAGRIARLRGCAEPIDP